VESASFPPGTPPTKSRKRERAPPGIMGLQQMLVLNEEVFSPGKVSDQMCEQTRHGILSQSDSL
jgi:hypothetical protein